MDLTDHPTVVLNYDTEEWPWAGLMADVLDIPVEWLTEIRDDEHDVVTRENDQGLNWHKVYYETVRKGGPAVDRLFTTYRRFICDWLSPLYKDALVYQRFPSFRVHVPGNKAVGRHHRDEEFGHQPQEHNWWLPFTDTHGTNTIWIRDRSYWNPQILKYGEILTFDGVRKVHGNVVNASDKARVSWDFRVVPASDWKPDAYDGVSINTGAKFTTDDYFMEAL